MSRQKGLRSTHCPVEADHQSAPMCIIQSKPQHTQRACTCTTYELGRAERTHKSQTAPSNDPN